MAFSLPAVRGLLPLAQRMTARAFHKRGLSRRRVRAGDVEVSLFDGAGQGALPHFVVQHGLGSSATALAPVIHRLFSHASRVSAVDLPGHGDSPDVHAPLAPSSLFETMTDVYDALIDRPAVLVGNSLGGTVFEWSDEWWKGNENLPNTWTIQDTAAHWNNASYYYDSDVPGGMNMNEEWWGIVALDPENKDNGMDARVPKKSYQVLQSLWASHS